MILKVCRIFINAPTTLIHHKFLKIRYSSLSKGFVPSEVEQDVTSFWNTCSSHPINEPNITKAGIVNFSMVLPPPNVTGTLHLGHAFTTTLQDVLAKRSCMKGEDVVWVPGLDHAGIATQAIVELALTASGHNIKQMTRDDLLNQIHIWKESKSEIILNQLKQLAPSLNWAKQFFTLDKNQYMAVNEAFIRLYSAGLIYRAERLVNWCVKLGSAISDMEVEYKQINGPTQLHPPSADEPVLFGQMTDVAYKLLDKPNKEIVVSTCRLETMPGDTAVAVHPEDSRYSAYHNCFLVHPLTAERLPLILDSYVDPNFGTGAVKVTPGHDHADFEMAQRHNLDIKSVIDETGTLNGNAGKYAGLNRFKARTVISDVLREGGYIRGIRDHHMSIPVCSRTKDVIELISKPQWFLKCNEMGLKALQAVEKGHLEIIPEHYTKHWYSYLENLRDWCISRQVVWGHRIPLFTDNNKEFVLANSDTIRDTSFHQVQDVLDTWFSSALLPFSAFGWPENKPDFNKYFPLDIMVTGHDILFFWVARMVMLSLQLTDKLPFKKVLLHSVICDPQGRKMSKSLGNVIDPQHVIQGVSQQALLNDVESRVKSGVLKKEEAELTTTNINRLFPNGIPQCGTDALRLTLLSHRIKNHYVHFDTEACYINKLFCNKLWQACKFTSYWSSKCLSSCILDRPPVAKSKLDVWLLGKLVDTVDIVNKSIDNFDFHIAVNVIKDFVQHTFCDVYLEGVKSSLKGSQEVECQEEICYILLFSLVNIIKLLAPLTPFLSEKLFQHLQPDNKTSVHCSEWPKENLLIKLPSDIDKVNENMTLCLNIVTEIRRLKLISKESKKDILSVGVCLKQDLPSDSIQLIENLSGMPIHIISNEKSDKWCLFSALGQEVFIFYKSPQKTDSVEEKVNVDLTKLTKLEKELDKILKMTSHESYKIKATKSVQKSHSDKVVRLQTQIQQLKIQR